MNNFVKAARHILRTRRVKSGAFFTAPIRSPWELDPITLALGAGGLSGLISYLGTEEKDQKLRNALIGALAGGGLTFGANALSDAIAKSQAEKGK